MVTKLRSRSLVEFVRKLKNNVILITLLILQTTGEAVSPAHVV